MKKLSAGLKSDWRAVSLSVESSLTAIHPVTACGTTGGRRSRACPGGGVTEVPRSGGGAKERWGSAEEGAPRGGGGGNGWR